jgi:hypothetical protein
MTSQVTGVVEAKAVKGMNTSILIGGEWYSSYKGAGLASIEKGSTVDFLWKPDAKGMGFRNIIASTVKNLGGSTPAPSGVVGKAYVPAAKAYSTLGVELGHASNLAMEMCLKMDSQFDPGTEEFYKAWVHHTDKIFTIMQKIRASKEKADAPVVAVSKVPEPVLAVEEKELMDSIF